MNKINVEKSLYKQDRNLFSVFYAFVSILRLLGLQRILRVVEQASQWTWYRGIFKSWRLLYFFK